MSEALMANTNLTELQLIDNCGFEDEDSARTLATAICRSSVRTLEVRGRFPGEGHERKIIGDQEEDDRHQGLCNQAFAQIINSSTTLQEMRLVKFPCSELVRDWLSLPPSLRKLHVKKFCSREHFDPWLCNVLTSNALKELKVEDCAMYDPYTFADSARGDISITHLEFLECQFFDPRWASATFFRTGWRSFPNLVSLEFNKCRLSGDEVSGLCSDNHLNIQRLSLADNHINIAGALGIIESIARRPVLREVNLSRNFLEYPRLQMIAEELQAFPNVLCIDLSSCIHWPHDGRGPHRLYRERQPEMDSKKAKEIARQEAAKAFLAAAKANRNIHHLNVRGNEFPLEIETEIQFHVGVHESFRDLLTARPASLATGAWSLVLARIQGRHDASVVPSLLYYILQERHDDLVPNQR